MPPVAGSRPPLLSHSLYQNPFLPTLPLLLPLLQPKHSAGLRFGSAFFLVSRPTPLFKGFLKLSVLLVLRSVWGFLNPSSIVVLPPNQRLSQGQKPIEANEAEGKSFGIVLPPMQCMDQVFAGGMA
ncbi:hypothetical protein AMTR_s00110p00140420 [Amborella trichopoda]|uniref:Uncharacterized protein n=1 Tax=Amborella trichopoda TaxID=13333 RepID=W1NSC8_AMBTC|nr:hypothetical protein AMTR_s00110p00140420 [Amborella trichopoda]